MTKKLIGIFNPREMSAEEIFDAAKEKMESDTKATKPTNEQELEKTLTKMNARLSRLETFFEDLNDFLTDHLPISYTSYEDQAHLAFHIIDGMDLISTDFLQRKLGLSYSHAAEVMEELVLEGVVVEEKDDSPRKVNKKKLDEYLKSERHTAMHKPHSSELTLYEERDVEQAVKLISQHDTMSVSMLQRRLGIGFNRAAHLMETLEEKGYVGPANGSAPRKVLIK